MKKIISLLDQYCNGIKDHSVVQLLQNSLIKKESVNAILKSLYADSLWWVRALEYMESEAQNIRFRQALSDNIACETGKDGGVAHLKLMEDLIRSISLDIDMKDLVYRKTLTRAQEENKMLKGANELQRAAFMLGTETLFPSVLSLIQPVLVEHYPNADMRYVEEHIEVDSGEHSVWMMESVESMLADGGSFDEVEFGLREAAHGAVFPFNLAVEVNASLPSARKQKQETLNRRSQHRSFVGLDIGEMSMAFPFNPAIETGPRC